MERDRPWNGIDGKARQPGARRRRGGMMGSASEPERRKRRFGRLFAASVSLFLATLSVTHSQRDLRLRRRAEKFRSDFAIDRRWPYVRNMRLEPAGDLAADIVVQAALREGPDGSRASVSRRNEELSAARDLMAEAIAVRPGWAYHPLLLGRVAAEAGRAGNAGPPVPPELWASPLQAAAEAAPGLDAAWVALGKAYLENWAGLSPATRAAALPVLRRALLDREFVARSFRAVVGSLRRSEAMAIVPESTGPLEAAAHVFSEDGDIEGVAQMMVEMDRAERQERAGDLREIEERNRLGDTEGLRAGCLAWSREHPAGDFDDPVGRAELARLLELWPSDRTGSWFRDARGVLVRFFLNGRQSDVRGETLARALESLSGVPDAVRARVKLLTGNLESAEELTRNVEDRDSPEWTSYFVELARLQLKRGDAQKARDALGRVSPAAREGCDVLIARREVARFLQDNGELLAVSRMLEPLRLAAQSVSASPGSSEASVSLCLDREWTSGRVLAVSIEVAAPAVVVYGWDGGRSGPVSVSERSNVLHVPVGRLSGRHTFSVRAPAGGPVRGLRAAVVAPTG